MRRGLFRPLLEDVEKEAELRRETIGLHKARYFDYTASGLGFAVIEARMREVLETYANTHSKEADMAETTQHYYSEARARLKASLELDDEFLLLPCGNGATSAIKRFQELVGIYIPPATQRRYAFSVAPEQRPLVVVGPYEHHSNEISYREALCETVRIGLNENGTIDLDQLESVLHENREREMIGAFCIASNVTGIITPYRKISQLLRKYGALVCFDAAASSPYMNVPCELYDAMFFSPHKLLGGPGSCGLLAIRNALIEQGDAPTFAGGGTVEYVNAQVHRFVDGVETREDAGTPGILQLIRAALAYQLRNELGFEWIKAHKQRLYMQMLEGLSAIEGCTVYGNVHADNIGIVSFNVEGIDPYALCAYLSSHNGLQTRAGCSCAGPYGHDLLGLEEMPSEEERPGWLRISLHYTQRSEEVDYLLDAIKAAITALGAKDGCVTGTA